MHVSRTELTLAPPQGIKRCFSSDPSERVLEAGIGGKINMFDTETRGIEKGRPLNFNPEDYVGELK
jgi:hypothetical protein